MSTAPIGQWRPDVGQHLPEDDRAALRQRFGATPPDPLIEDLERTAQAALVELADRRRLAIIPLAMIAIVAGLLYWKIRTLGGDPVSPSDRAESKEQR